jgi:hypothetical protein
MAGFTKIKDSLKGLKHGFLLIAGITIRNMRSVKYSPA